VQYLRPIYIHKYIYVLACIYTHIYKYIHTYTYLYSIILGISDPSNKLIAFTSCAVPNAPPPVEILKITTNGLLLSWHPPKNDNGKYMLLYMYVSVYVYIHIFIDIYVYIYTYMKL
jgi:hypothetical protein